MQVQNNHKTALDNVKQTIAKVNEQYDLALKSQVSFLAFSFLMGK
jgi:hypothetical protein